MAITKRSTKIGMNRSKPRVWIEGAALIQAGFARGDKFSATIKEGRLVIQLDADGARTVSGKGDKPIVDIATGDLLTIAPIGTILALSSPKAGRLVAKVAND